MTSGRGESITVTWDREHRTVTFVDNTGEWRGLAAILRTLRAEDFERHVEQGDTDKKETP